MEDAFAKSLRNIMLNDAQALALDHGEFGWPRVPQGVRDAGALTQAGMFLGAGPLKGVDSPIDAVLECFVGRFKAIDRGPSPISKTQMNSLCEGLKDIIARVKQIHKGDLRNRGAALPIAALRSLSKPTDHADACATMLVRHHNGTPPAIRSFSTPPQHLSHILHVQWLITLACAQLSVL